LGSSSSMRVLRRIRIVWWSCFISILLYSIVPLVIDGFSLDVGTARSSDGLSLTVFLLALVFSFFVNLLPFSLLGRGYVMRRQGSPSAVLSSAVLRLGMTEVAVIFGVAIFFITDSFEMFVPFSLISVLGLLLLRNEARFYRVVLGHSSSA
jgi:hypothetical protein